MKNFKAIILLTLLLVIAACANQVSGGRETVEKSKETGAGQQTNDSVKVPQNMKYAEKNQGFYDESTILFTLPNNETILGRKGTLSTESIDQELIQLARKHPGYSSFSRIYIMSDAGVDFGKVMDIYQLAAKRNINYVGLVVSSTEETAKPVNVFNLFVPNTEDMIKIKSKPSNAFTQFITLEKDGRMTLNSSAMENTERLREALYKLIAHRPDGKERSKKEVLIKAPRSVSYGEVVKLIDAAGGGGAFPIILETY